MANTLKIELGWKYIINGDIFRLEDIQGPYFILIPLKVGGVYSTQADGSILMKAMIFAAAEIYGGEI